MKRRAVSLQHLSFLSLNTGTWRTDGQNYYIDMAHQCADARYERLSSDTATLNRQWSTFWVLLRDKKRTKRIVTVCIGLRMSCGS